MNVIITNPMISHVSSTLGAVHLNGIKGLIMTAPRYAGYTIEANGAPAWASLRFVVKKNPIHNPEPKAVM
jgi:hypothetical protein